VYPQVQAHRITYIKYVQALVYWLYLNIAILKRKEKEKKNNSPFLYKGTCEEKSVVAKLVSKNRDKFSRFFLLLSNQMSRNAVLGQS
jgi:hypothetical protein